MTITPKDITPLHAVAEADKAGADGKAWDEAITPEVVIALCDEMLSLWNALPRALTRTSEPPKVPGWYWWRIENVIGVESIKDPKNRVVDDYRVQWAGPIPESREPK